MNATSPAAKSSPIRTEAISATETRKSAVKSWELIMATAASRIIGIPQRIMAIHAGLKGREKLKGYDVESAIIYEGK